MNVQLGKKCFFVRLGKQTETKLWLLETKAAAAFGEIGFTPLSFLVENKGLGLINQLTRLYFKQKKNSAQVLSVVFCVLEGSEVK